MEVMGCGWGAQGRPIGQSKPGRNCFFSAVVGTVGTVLALGEEHCLQKGGRSLLIGCIKTPSAPSQSWLQVVALSSAVRGVPQVGPAGLELCPPSSGSRHCLPRVVHAGAQQWVVLWVFLRWTGIAARGQPVQCVLQKTWLESRPGTCHYLGWWGHHVVLLPFLAFPCADSLQPP